HMTEAAAAYTAFLVRVLSTSAQREHAAVRTARSSELDLLFSLYFQNLPRAQDWRIQLLAAVLDNKGLSTAALTQRHEALALAASPQTRRDHEELRALRQRLADLHLQGPAKRTPQEYLELCQRLRQEEDERERDLA